MRSVDSASPQQAKVSGGACTSPMASVPQEIIEGIMEEVGDTRSLKACALVASRFRAPTQRVLLRAMTLDDFTPKYLAACKFIRESPHVVPYIRDLTVSLTWVVGATPSAIESFGQLLEKLTNVRRLAVIAGCTWEALAPVAPAILDFVRQRDIEELCVQSIINLVPSALLLLLSTVNTLSFKGVTIPEDVAPIGINGTIGSTVQSLWLARSDGLRDFLAQPVYLAALRTLTLTTPPSENEDMLSLVSNTLEHLRFDCKAAFVKGSLPWSLPSLVALHTISLLIPSRDLMLSWLPSKLSSLLASRPRSLSSIHIIYSTPVRSAQQYSLQQRTLKAVDSMVAGKSAAGLHWRVAFSDDALGQGQHFRDFVKFVQQGMPRLNGEGRLIFDRPTVNELRKWPGI
ncbi:hypothetical protein B0H14DRAFT_2703918 [Mycena olivaceomarginata]|nr:hypothetical protein B0H14DRAFT_2703918 [Mycena olivaceomarginata]